MALIIKVDCTLALAITYSLFSDEERALLRIMATSDSALASSLGCKAEDRNNAACCTRTPFMISDILDSSRRSPPRQQRCTGECSSEPEDDATSEDRDHSAGASSDTESAVDGDGEQTKLLEDNPSEDIGCAGSPKSSSAGSPGEFLVGSLHNCKVQHACFKLEFCRQTLKCIVVAFCVQALQLAQ